MTQGNRYAMMDTSNMTDEEKKLHKERCKDVSPPFPPQLGAYIALDEKGNLIPAAQALNFGSIEWKPDLTDNLPEQDVIVHERKPLYQPEVMPESEYANRRACIYDSMKAAATRRHMVARACTNHREFDFTVNGVKQAVNYILSMAGKEYKQYLPNEVPSFSEYRNSTVGYNKLINVVIECTKTGYKQRLTLGVIGDKVWVLTDAVRYMRKSLNEGRARHMAMLALTDYDRVYPNQWSAGISPKQQQVSLHLSK